MTDIAKVFMSGRSQAVRLPKKYRLDVDEVEIHREGDALVLRPRPSRSWQRLRGALEDFGQAEFDDCFGDGREQPDAHERPDLDALLDP